jgi:hypothetical protein
VIKNLIVCGDSFNAVARFSLYKGTHWSEHLSKMLNVSLINLASAGCSNRMIVMQAEEAMKYDDSLIMIAPAASSARIELTTDSSRIFDQDISLKNFLYHPPRNASADTFIRSINTSGVDNEAITNRETKRILLETLPFGFFSHIDKWALHYMLDQLKKKKKNFLFFETVWWPPSQILSYEQLAELIDKDCIIARHEYSFQFYINSDKDKTFKDPGYHSTPEDQLKTANILFEIIKQRSKADK